MRGEGEGETVEKILDAIKSNPKITQNELMEVTSLTRRGVEWNLAKLKQKGILKESVLQKADAGKLSRNNE